MARTVFDNSMVAHVWAAMKQPHGRSSSGNFSFDALTLYSYATPIARIVRDVNGGLCALHYAGSYSCTTTRHQTEARTASAHMQRFDVRYVTARSEGRSPRLPEGCHSWQNPGMSDIELIHKANLAWYIREFDAYVSALMDRTPAQVEREALRGAWSNDTFGRVPHEPRHLDYNRAATLLGEAQPFVQMHRYAVAFGLKEEGRNLFEIAGMITQSYAHKLIAWNEPQRVKAREKSRAKSAAKRAEQAALAAERQQQADIARNHAQAENLAAWLQGAFVNSRYLPRDAAQGASLRVKEELLETSWGASVPLAHAVRVLRAVEACRAKGEGWKRNGHTLHVGHFQVDEIMPNGDFKAGCHFVKWQEVERVAGALGLLGGQEGVA